MNQKQQNRLSMMKAVRDTNQAAKETWEGMKPYKKANDDLNAKITEIDQAAEDQQLSSTGITQDKQAWAEAAVDKVLNIAKNGRVYALEVKNLDLHEQLDVSEFYLLNLPDNEQNAALKAVLTAINPFVNNLADYMITAAVMDEAQAAVAQSEEVLAKPRTAITAHSTVTASVNTLLTEATRILERMDDLIHNFEKTNPAFVSNYKNARMIIDRGSRSDGNEDKTPPPAV
jgi:hypothetical protein